MSTATRRERERQDLKELILDGARRVFEREGHDKLSIRKVAREIDYSPGTIYLYYKDKDALMLALHRDAFRRKSELFAPLMQLADPAARLEAMGRAYIHHALHQEADFHLMFIDKCPMAALREEGVEWRHGNTAFGMLVATVSEGVEAGVFRPSIQPESMAVVLWSMVHGCATLILSERLGMLDDASRARAVDDVFAQMDHLLLADAAPLAG